MMRIAGFTHVVECFLRLYLDEDKNVVVCMFQILATTRHTKRLVYYWRAKASKTLRWKFCPADEILAFLDGPNQRYEYRMSSRVKRSLHHPALQAWDSYDWGNTEVCNDPDDLAHRRIVYVTVLTIH